MRTPKPLLAIGFSIAMFSGRAQLTYHQVGLADQITGPGASLLTPFVDYFENHKTSLVYKAPDLLAAGVQAGPIHSIRFYVVDLNGCGLLEDFAVRMTNTPATTLSSYLGGTNVWGPASYQPVAGTNTFELNVPFAWDGTSNLYVEICKGPSLPNTGDFASGNARVYVNGTSYTAFRGYFADNTLNLCSTTLSNANSTAVPTIWVGQVVDCLGAVDGPALPGMPCSDGDACTENDTYQLDCQCIGSPLPDTDGDDICDTQDACPNDPDNDADGDGLCADIDPCPLAVSGIADFNDATCNCDPGYYKVTSLMGSNTVITGCTICPPGSYCPDGLAALPCAAGTYNPVPGATECIACAFDEFSIPGATSCSFDPTCTTVLSLDITLPGFALNGPTYELRRVVNDQLIAEGGGGFMNQGVTPLAFCVPNGSFYLKMNNMVAGARYVLRKAGNPGTRIIDNIATLSGVNRVDEFTVSPSQLSSRGAVQIPPGPTELLYTSCDKQFWKKGEFIVVNEDPDVAAEWVPGGGTAGQSSTTGYDFWFYDPNGGYSFIRQRRHNVTDGFGNVGSARTCHMQVNNWAAANWIPNQLPLNVRVRAVVNNVPKNWGPACRFVRDDALANCPPTQLMDVPGNPFISCNVFRDFNNQSINRLYARPVSGATKYRFIFTNAELVQPIVREVTTYYLTLGWNAGVAPPLTAGSTYQVRVQAFKGSWCAIGDLCYVNMNNQVTGGQQSNSFEVPSNAAFKLWPNPNRGDQLNVELEVPKGVGTISIDLLDLAGDRVATRAIAVQEGSSRTVVDLNGDLSAGVYLVHITAGDLVYTRRLVIQP